MASDVDAVRIAAQNRKARHNYTIEDSIEAGIVLQGSEVKSLREGRATISESYATEQGGELFLINSYIPEYKQAGQFNHEPRRPRKLLLHRRQIARMIGAIQRDGMTLVPLKLYFNSRGKAKLQLGLAKGKKAYDKRQAEKKKDWDRQKARLMREKG
ncbi:MAG: SsrA-binding protein [Rhodospirillaceae bacterium]|nr:SsrA-binding protein [Rhodospirillaceae bacterium]|tara:strand:- start:5792 stop:6262 length:471 start_codon:yes stop_codon:yes gene_type:complete